MPEQLADKTIFSLFEVAKSIRKTISERYRTGYWIKAEMNKLNYYAHSGHCYPELLEKKEGKVVAEMKAILWKSDYGQINRRFLEMTKEPLKNGINILFWATIDYDPVHGLSLRILDIDPAYSLGELARERQENIQTLQRQGHYDRNRTLDFPLLPKRIALISVETSKGLADFLKIIDGNPYGYRFEHQLFPALLQGEKAIGSIQNQLKRIAEMRDLFDVVAIIRGGGGDVGLSAYNNLELATAIATFPLPVLTGIGHATNETVAELVAYKNAITPSELADFLIQRFHEFARPVDHAKKVLKEKTIHLLNGEQRNLQSSTKTLRSAIRHVNTGFAHQIHNLSVRLLHETKYQLMASHERSRQLQSALLSTSKSLLLHSGNSLQTAVRSISKDQIYAIKRANQLLSGMSLKLIRQTKHITQQHKITFDAVKPKLMSEIQYFISLKAQALAAEQRNVHLLDPVHVLKRGYSITLLNGQALKMAKDVKEGDEIKTILVNGELISKVINKS